ncbi:MAG TPA: hypothetical protein VMT16_13820 [Thermoanaerobaculia bacterium]|nr:hypothetical protein [Thermoanaerobaculia bacterium]
MRPLTRLLALSTAALALAVPASSQDLRFEGWGPRLGVADDPDQVVVGAFFDLGDLLPHLRLLPSLELGLGDDHTTLTATLPVHYIFPVDWGDFQPYAGGGLLLAWIDRDEPAQGQRGTAADDDDFELAPVAVAGIEYRTPADRVVSLELHLGGGDAFDARLLAGLRF